MSESTTVSGAFCALCHEFVRDLLAFDFIEPTVLPSRWQPVDKQHSPGWGSSFHHHDTIKDLEMSSYECEMCHVLYSDLAELSDQGLCRGWLGLYPWWNSGWIGVNKQKGHFRAGFRHSLMEMRLGVSQIGDIPVHTFKLCRRGELLEGEQPRYADALRRFRATPTDQSSKSMMQNVERWILNCRKSHTACKDEQTLYSLPTRVIDLGENEEQGARLYESHGERAPYIALSHCWGGIIPSETVELNIKQRYIALNTQHLPRNFQDAIEVAKALRIRYLWIDALCIIQDSKEDWTREAGQMASVYAGATIVVSVLDAASSTVGFLDHKRAPLAVVNDEYAVQKVYLPLYEYFENIPLGSRGWCMQERLLAPRVLHIGREQMFWECATCLTCEDEKVYYPQNSGHAVGIFLQVRSRMLQQAEYDWDDWFLLLEEYTTRKLTMPSDKLPALAGAASLFLSRRPGATYLAGLWGEDLARGLQWGAYYTHVAGRKTWGYSSADKCSLLTRPTETRAPSWSWAAIDGQIIFVARRSRAPVAFEILEIDMSVGENSLTESNPRGSLHIRGHVAEMLYHPPTREDDHVGSLTFAKSERDEDKTLVLGGCVLDTDRHQPRHCWALVGSRTENDLYLLILSEGPNSIFQRIGISTVYRVKMDTGRFETQAIVLS
ncbi:heterokaryon incompatibility protein-domain-containing protein [Xylariales sp. PMI_506]|nr:heterokaryon incompatibility protein-domain-containing protein [Xylariales sp. PMI_506]